MVAWSLTAALVVAVLVAGPFLAGWERMLAIVAALFIGFKLVAMPQRRGIPYLFFWPGLDPRPFEGERRTGLNGWGLILQGAIFMAAGLGLILMPVSPGMKPWLAMIGALFAAHLGLFDVLAGFWKRMGTPVERVCPDPWRARSPAEFWGRRWNLAFHVFVRTHIYRPAARAWGRGAAVVLVFLVSGFLHELVISFPAGGGWGLPMLYFVLQGAAVVLERKGLLPKSRILTAMLVLLPAPVLFHPPFVENVIFPMVMP